MPRSPVRAATGHLGFPTALGECAVAWSPDGIVRIELPGEHDGDAVRAVAAAHPGSVAGEPPPAVRQAVTAIQRQVAGEPADLRSIQLDMDGITRFRRRVYEAARSIPSGTTVTYGELAAMTGRPDAARAVGQALGRNPFPVVVPCHRVLGAGGGIGGFSAPGGTGTKRRMLAGEGVAVGAVVGVGGRPPFDVRRAVRHLRDADAGFGRVLDAVGPCRMELGPVPSMFAALAETVVHQQLSPRAAGTIHGRLCALVGDAAGVPQPDRVLALRDGALRAAGLSTAKERAVRDLASRAVSGQLPTVDEAAAMDDEAVVAALSAARGVGRWTAEIFLLFRLGRPDVLPLGDYGMRRGFAAAFGLDAVPGPDEVERRAEAWRPYRSVASWYLWRYLDLPG